VGFIFHHPSPRCILPEQARKIIRNLPASICTVGVFVNLDPADLMEIAAFCGIDLIQLHGDESPEYCRQFPAERLIKALFPRDERAVEEAAAYPARAILIDSRTPSRFGGTGRTADWSLAKKIKALGRPLVLAGGLNPENVAAAVAAVGPDAVDFNSGVEFEPGRKDPDKIARAVAAVRQADLNRGRPRKIIFARCGP
jgi:phosphoribosylanthranilate isomerase